MKHFLTVLLISAGLLLQNTDAKAQKFGYINADEVISLMPEAATFQKEIEEYQRSLYQNANDKQIAFNEALEKFTKDSATMAPSLKEVKREELIKQSVELNQQEQIIAQQMENKRQQLVMPIQKKLQEAIDAVAKENGYTYIFAREALVVVPEKDDIGPLVIKKLGLKTPAPAAGNNPAGK